MGTENEIRVNSLNIKTHPHSPKKYLDLFFSAFEYGTLVKIWGFEWGCLGGLSPISEDMPIDGIVGVIFRFLNIDPREEWVDVKTRMAVELDESSSEWFVPENLKPNLRKIPFVFFPKKHRILFDAESLPSRLARGFFLKIFSTRNMYKEFGDVEVIIESSMDKIQEIINMPAKTKLEISISVPNQDDVGDCAQKVIDRMIDQKAKRLYQSYSASKKKNFNPDRETLELMRLAAHEGWVRVTAYPAGKRTIETTKQHPWEKTIPYEPEVEDKKEVLAQHGENLIDIILSATPQNKE